MSPSHFTDPVIRVAKDSLVSTAMPWRDDNIAHVVGVTTDAIWLGESQGFDNSTLVRLDRATGDRRVILSAPDSSPYLFADEAVWVAVVTDPDAHQIEVITLEPEPLREVGRVTVPGEFPVLVPADPATATSTW